MTNFFKTMKLTIPGLLMTVTAQANSDNYIASGYGLPENCEVCAPPCCETSCCGGEFKVWGELLYWTANLCGLESAFGDTLIETTVSQGIVTTTVTESHEEPHRKWNTGFRVGGNLEYNCWDLEGSWTQFHGHAKFRDGGQFGSWKLHYNVFDVLIGRAFTLAPCFTFEPFIGVRGLNVHQSLRSHLETTVVSLIGTSLVFTDKLDREKIWGIGPRVGVEADIGMFCNFSFYGIFGLTTFYGHTHAKNFDTDTFTITVSSCRGKGHLCFDTLGTDLALGIRWDGSWCMCGCNINLMLKLGFDQQRIYQFSNLGSDGALSLYGGSFGAGVGFNY